MSQVNATTRVDEEPEFSTETISLRLPVPLVKTIRSLDMCIHTAHI
jgi:hypothetical protein